MSALVTPLATLALLGAALVGGIFFAFSSFVMRSLARLPAPEGITAMQSINVVVINPLFLGAFLGTGVLSLVMAGLAVAHWDAAPAAPFLCGAILYVAGTVLVTLRGNVPLNDRLAAVAATDPAARGIWAHYLVRWTRWNHVRTLAATAAALSYTLGLVRHVVA